ncbi:MAG: beta-lactamase family protein, partial [Bacteroidales bacterium]
ILLLFLTFVSLNQSLIQVRAKDNMVPVQDSARISAYGYDFNTLVSSYDKFFSKEFGENNCPGAAVTIVKDSGIKWLKGYGVKEAGTNDSVDINTVFRIGSVSKGFAAVITGIMIKKNVLNWDDKVKTHLSDFLLKDSVNTNELTIRNIISHTTGLPKHTYTNLLDRNVPYDDIIKLLVDVPAISAPGEVYSYQNVVFSLIGNILQKITGKCYNSLVVEEIFEPLEMHNSSIDFYNLVNSNNLARPHVKINNTYKSRKNSEKYYSVSPASGVNMSISDMSKWLAALLGNNPDVIDTVLLKEIFKPHIRTYIKYKYYKYWKDLGDLHYGLGWRVFNYRGKEIIYHGGYVNGYRAEVALSPEEGIGIAVLMNSSSKLAHKCIPQFFDIYFENAFD